MWSLGSDWKYSKSHLYTFFSSSSWNNIRYQIFYLISYFKLSFWNESVISSYQLMCFLWWKHFSALWWEAEEAPFSREDAEPMPWSVQGTLGNSSTSAYSSHYISISSSDSLINYRPWNTDQKGLVTLNSFHVPASPWISAVEHGLGSGGEPLPARWDASSSLGEENLEQCHRSLLPADPNPGSWGSL